MCMTASKGKARQWLKDYITWPAQKQLEYARAQRPQHEEHAQIDRDYYAKKFEMDTSTKPYCVDGCTMSRSTVGDSSSMCCVCYNIRPDFEQWIHDRIILQANWSRLNAGPLNWDTFAPAYIRGPRKVIG